MKMIKHCKSLFILIFAIILTIFSLTGIPKAYSTSLAIVYADNGANTPVTELLATGLFSSVDTIDAYNSTPTLANLAPYDVVLAYTNLVPDNNVLLGNVLADYVDSGGGLGLATYGFSGPWTIHGRITDPGYSPLTMNVMGDVSGNLVAVDPTDPIFNGIDLLSLTYFHNTNFAHPGLDPGATLLATDGSGINMIARNSASNIIGLNLWPGTGIGTGSGTNNEQFYNLLGNSLVSTTNPVPEPTTMFLLGTGLVGVAGAARRKKKNQA